MVENHAEKVGADDGLVPRAACKIDNANAEVEVEGRQGPKASNRMRPGLSRFLFQALRVGLLFPPTSCYFF